MNIDKRTSYNVEIYTDGAALGNPGPGGYGVILECNGHRKEFSAGYARTTNNRMELMAVIVGLETLTQYGCVVHVFTDSQYVVNSVECGWLIKWEQEQFKRAKNSDLWKRFLKIYRQHHVKFHWIKGHSGHLQNEICDRLAVEAAAQKNLPNDEGYLSNLQKAIF